MRDNFISNMLGGRKEEVSQYLHKRITWCVNQAVIRIPDPTQTAPANFEVLDHCCEILSVSLLSIEALDIMSHTPKFLEWHVT